MYNFDFPANSSWVAATKIGDFTSVWLRFKIHQSWERKENTEKINPYYPFHQRIRLDIGLSNYSLLLSSKGTSLENYGANDEIKGTSSFDVKGHMIGF